MKSKFNRLLSVLLLVCMLVSFVPATAYAEELADVEEPNSTEELAVEQTNEPLDASPFAVFSSCTVTFNANYPDNTNEVITQKVSYRTANGFSLATAYKGSFAKDGYVMTGWNTKANGTGTSYALNATVKGASTTLTLYAQWTPGFTVTYDDGAWGQAFAAQVYTVKAGEATPAFVGTPAYAGHTFLGWEPEVAETVTTTATYKATWDPEPEKPTLKKPNGVTDTEVADMEIRAYAVGTEVLNPNKEMYSCNPSINAPGVSSYEIGQVYGNDIDGYFQDITFHFEKGDDFEADARRVFNTHNVLGKYEEWQGEWTYDFSRFSADQTLTLIWSSGDWYTASTLTEGKLSNISANVSNHIKVYLKLPTFFVTYTDGVEEEELFADQSYEVKPDSATPAFEGTPEREGYTFDGWDPKVADTVTEDVTYTAVWNAVEYTLPVDPANGEDAYDVTITYDDVVGDKLETPVWEGRTFTGWVDQDGEAVDVDALYTAGLESMTATWSVNEYTLPVDPANGEDAYDVTITYEDVVGDKVEEPVWEGRTFEGWVDHDGEAVDVDALYTAGLESMTATWSVNEYTLAVDPANGEDAYEVTITYEDVVGDKVEEPVWEGRTFEGWVDQDGEAVDVDALYTAGLESMTATWSVNKYTLAVDPANGEDAYKVTITYEDVVGDKVEEPVWEGHTFTGWVDQDGETVDVDVLYTAALESMTATWKLTEYVVPVDPANGVKPTDVIYTYEDVIGDKYDFSKDPTRKGYTFQGWVDQDGNPVDLKATYTEDIESINGSWKGKTYTVTFKLNEDEGTLSFTSKRVVNGDPLGYTPMVKREGYTFIGWYDENGKYYDAETIFDAARDITLTGRWIKTIVPTGDESAPALFALLMLGSLACAGAIILRLRKREDEV